MSKYIFLSSTCSVKMYEYVSANKFVDKVNPSQKFFKLLMEGLAKNIDEEVHCVSIRTINPHNSNLNHVKFQVETENGVKYYYVKIRNKKIISYWDMISNSYHQLKELIKQTPKGEKIIVFTDGLAICPTVSALLFCKLHKIKNCAILTDMPSMVTAIAKKKNVSKFRLLKDRLLNRLIQSFNGYCFLTETMNEFNDKNKPYTVIEAIATDNADTAMIPKEKKPFVIMYAGGLYKKFGVKALVDAVDSLQDQNVVLQVYGEGELKDYIIGKGKKNPNIQYQGIVSPEQIFEYEKKASLLINCRFTKEIFTKYSFPSKTIEYMSSGTPVLTTRLAGIPEEYRPYLYFIDEETVNGIADSIQKLTRMDCEQLAEFGLKAKNFVLKNKNKTAQGKKLKDFVEGL